LVGGYWGRFVSDEGPLRAELTLVGIAVTGYEIPHGGQRLPSDTILCFVSPGVVINLASVMVDDSAGRPRSLEVARGRRHVT